MQARRRWPGRVLILLAEEEGDKKEAVVGWAAGGAGPAGLPGEQQVGLLLFFNFSSVCFI